MPPPLYPQPPSVPPVSDLHRPVSALHRGELTVWKDDRGFGFIRPNAGGQDVFLHISALRERPRRPQVGDSVCYHLATGPDGKLRAEDAFLLGVSPPPRPRTSPGSVSALLAVLVLTGLVMVASAWLFRTTLNPLPLLAYPLLSAGTFGMYAHDKDCAGRGAWRVPESTLHALELFGGWPGAGIAQQLLRHKNRKAEYQTVYRGITFLHVIGWLSYILWFMAQGGK